MKDPCQSPAPRTVYKIRGPETWKAVARMYQEGATAAVAAEIFGVGVRNLRRRARDEGWRKCDLPDLPAPPIPVAAPDDVDPVSEGSPDVRSAVRDAVARAARLMAQGSFAQATEAMKAAELIGRLADRLDVTPDPKVADAATMDDLRRKIIGLCAAVSEPEAEAGAEAGAAFPA